MPRKIKTVSISQELDACVVQQNVFEKKQKCMFTQKDELGQLKNSILTKLLRKLLINICRFDSVHSCDELEMAEEASVTPQPVSAGCFVFPPPPPPQLHPRRPVSTSCYCYSISDSDSQSESGGGLGEQSSPIAIHHPLLTFRGYQSDSSPVAFHSLPSFLPPIGVFWDIENCQVSF